MSEDENDFRSYRKLIIRQLEVQDGALERLRDEMQVIKTALAVQNAKAAMIATLISLGLGVVGLVVKFL